MDVKLESEVVNAAHVILHRHRIGYKYTVVAGRRQSGKTLLAKTLYGMMEFKLNGGFNMFLYAGYRNTWVRELSMNYSNFNFLFDEYSLQRIRGQNLEKAILFLDEVNSQAASMIRHVVQSSGFARIGHVVLSGESKRKLKPYDPKDLSTLPLNYMEALASQCGDDTIWLGDWDGE